MQILRLRHPVGLSEFLLSVIEIPEVRTLLKTVPVFLTAVDEEEASLMHLSGRITKVSIDSDFGRLYTSGLGIGGWNCGPHKYTLPVVGVGVGTHAVHILFLNQYRYDPPAGSEPRTDFVNELVPAGFSFWKEEEVRANQLPFRGLIQGTAPQGDDRMKLETRAIVLAFSLV